MLCRGSSGYIESKNLRLWPHGFRIYSFNLGLSLNAAKLLIREQGLDSSEQLRVLINKNVDDICNVVRKPGNKNADGTPNRGQQVAVIAQENLTLAIFVFHHRWRCTLDLEVTGVHEDRELLLAGEKKCKDECKDSYVLPKIKKSYMAGMMVAIEEYLRSC